MGRGVKASKEVSIILVGGSCSGAFHVCCRTGIRLFINFLVTGQKLG
jgi:hypothetical protein